jgi:hypothetical protein
MAVSTVTAPAPVGRLDHVELRRFLKALRRQLWWRNALMFVAIGALVGAVAGAFVAGVWMALPALAIAAIVAIARRPSVVRAARVADRQLHTDNRLATAAEVLDGKLGGALASHQLDDAWHTASTVAAWRAFPGAWRQVQISAGVLAISVVLLTLSIAGVFTPVDVIGLVTAPPQADDLPVDDAQADLADQVAAADDAKPVTASSMDDLQSQAAQSQAAQAALQKLADSLRQTAAARDVGDSLRAGNYDDAISKLNSLATESDQLSRISKRELAGALERSAVDSAQTDAPLAVAEDRVARALTRNTYADTRSTMQDLAKAVSDARNGVISQEELARELEQLQQQQQQPQAPGGGGGDIGESDTGYIPDIPGEAPKSPGLVQGLNSSINVPSAPGPEGDPSKATRSSVGQEAGGDPFGDATSRLELPPTSDLAVDAQVSPDTGRAAQKANPVAPIVKISDANQNSVQQSDVVQASDPVQAVADKNVESTEQRGAVRSYFKPATDTGNSP